MAYYNLTENFNAFFKRINPSPSFVKQASSEYNTIKGLIEDKDGFAKELNPICFLQGSYQRDTAIYSINDIDIVTLCELWYPGSGNGKSWSRNEIFDKISLPLNNDGRYRDKLKYNSNSMCIKVDLGIKVEILPVVYRTGNNDWQKEPFMLYRPESNKWDDGYARYHQRWLTWKNSNDKTEGNFIPAIKIFKHINSLFDINAVSFHIECFLFSISVSYYKSNTPDYLNNLFYHIASKTADEWYGYKILTPCKERDIFIPNEWGKNNWKNFHNIISEMYNVSKAAVVTKNKDNAIEIWQAILGKDYFPKLN